MFLLLLLYSLLQTVPGSSVKAAIFEKDSIDKCYDPPTSIESLNLPNVTRAQCAISSLNKNSWRFLHCSADAGQSCSVGGVSSLPGSYKATECQCYTTEKTCTAGECVCLKGFYGDQCQNVVIDCQEAKAMGMGTGDQATWIKPNSASKAFIVLCDYDWGTTYIQYRPKVECGRREDFYRPWEDYVNGFGNISCEHWLGLEKIHQLTSQKNYQLEINAEAGSAWGQCFYDKFIIDGAFNNYTLHLDSISIPPVNPFIGDSLLDPLYNVDGKPFSTYDHHSLGNDCSVRMRSGWWFSDNCTVGNVNGPYLTEAEFAANQTQARLTWDTYSAFKTSTIKIVSLRIYSL